MKRTPILTLILILAYALMMSACGIKETHTPDDHAGELEHADSDHETHTDEHGMDIDQVQEEDNDHDHEHEHEQEEETVTLDERAINMIGLRTDKIREHALMRQIRLSGHIEANNDNLQHVYPRFSGLVEDVYVSMGDSVKKGDILACVQNNETLAEYCVYSALDGIVISKHITIGEIVKEDSRILTVADLSDVWVEFDVYAQDLDHIRLGQTLKIRALGLDREVTGVISYLSPVMDKEKRSITARVVLPNTNGRWSPGMFVTGELAIKTADSGLAVPNEAVQIIEGRSAVFTQVDKTSFEPVFIETGKADANFTLVESGLDEHDKIVTKGAFELKAKLVTSNLGSHAGHGH